MPNNNSEQYQWKNISVIKLEEFYLKFKPRTDPRYSPLSTSTDLDRLFRAIKLFSSTLSTLSLDFTDIDSMSSNGVRLNGVKLETDVLIPMTKLENFYFYARIHEWNDAIQILSTFQTFPWSIGVHENAYLYSLPFPFQELKKFRSFQYVLSNDDEILKHTHRLWAKVRSLELIPIDEIDLKNLLPLIKLNMPKLSSITYFGGNFDDSYDHNNSDDSYDEIERINVQLDSVTTLRLEDMSMKKIHQILIHSFPNLQCLILDHTELPLKENELTSFLGQKIQRIESDESSLQGNPAQVKDFSYLSNLKHIKLTYGFTRDEESLNSRSRIVTNLLTKLPKLESLSIYAIPPSGCIRYRLNTFFDLILNGLDQDQIKIEYETKYCERYMWFIKKIL